MKPISIFKAFPFLVYFDIAQCAVLLLLTLVILFLTVAHFRKNKPSNLALSRPSSFEYFVLKGEHSEFGDSKYGAGTASSQISTGTVNGTTGPETDQMGLQPSTANVTEGLSMMSV